MEMNEKKVDLEFVDSLFEELNEKIETDVFNCADASCNTCAGGIGYNPKFTLSW